MKNNEAYEVLNRMFDEKGWRGDIKEGVLNVLSNNEPLTKVCEHAAEEDLDRLAFEIPFQKSMQDVQELTNAKKQKEAWELILEISKEATEKKTCSPNPQTILTAKRNLILSQILRESIKPHEAEKIKQNLEDEKKEALFVELLIGKDSEIYKAVLNEIAEWERLLASAS